MQPAVNEGSRDKRDAVDRQFADWLEKKATKGLNFNDALYDKRDFYNPAMADTLLSYSGLVECQSNLDPSVFDTSKVPQFDYELVAANQLKEYEESRRR
jgi:hypothetical protein